MTKSVTDAAVLSRVLFLILSRTLGNQALQPQFVRPFVRLPVPHSFLIQKRKAVKIKSW